MRPARRTRLAVLVALAALVGATACEPETKPGTARVVVFGDSVPNFLLRDGPAGVDGDAITLIDGTKTACEGARGNPLARNRAGQIVGSTPECGPGWPSLYPPKLGIRADVAIVMGGNRAMLDHLLDGTWRHPCHSPFRTWYRGDLEERLAYLRTRADRVVLVLPAWPTPLSGWIMPADYVKRADCVRSWMRSAAAATGAVVVDFGAFLCPTGPTTCTDWRLGDGVHVDAEHAATVVAWLLASAAPPAPAPAPPPPSSAPPSPAPTTATEPVASFG
jgi:hypothetical protein